MCEEVVWKDIPEYEGYYQASNTGEIRSIDRIARNGRLYKGKTLSKYINKEGYYTVVFCINNNNNTILVHRAVASAFYGKSDLVVNHKDGNRINNNIENLEFCTQSENVKHAYKLGLQKPLRKKVICIDDGKIYEWAGFVNTNDINSTKNILRVCTGERLSYNGKHYAFYDDYINGITRARERTFNTKKVIDVDTGIIYNSVTDASLCFGSKHASSITKVCKGYRNSYKGHKFMFYNEHIELKGENFNEC